MPESICAEALRITSQDRNDDYGPPEIDLENIGRAWAATVQSYTGLECPDLPAHLVALMMIQLKVIREAYAPKRDSRVDIVGYALCADRSVPS